jgi:hypothetical protein
LSAFKSPFEKLSYEAQREIADSVNPGGPMYNLLEDIAENINQLNARESKVERVSLFGGLTMKEALAWRLLGEKGLTSIAKGFGAIAEVIDKMSTSGEEAKEKMEAIGTGLVAIKGLGKAILEFAGYLLLATPLLLVGVIAAPLFALSIFVITKALAWASKPLMNKETQDTLKALGDIGNSILQFGIKLALSALVYPFAIVGAVLAGIVITLIGLTFMALEKMGVTKTMEKASTALVFTGLAILSLGVSLALFAVLLPPDEKTLMTIGLVGLTVIGVGLAFALIGKFAGNVYIGALVMGFSALALIGIALGIKIFADAIKGLDSPWEFLAQVGITIVGLGLAMAAAGAVAPLILAGAASMLVAGTALVVIGAGLMVMSKVFQGTGWKNMLAPSGDTGLLGGSVSNLEKLLSAVGYSFMWDPIRAASILVGSSAMLVAGAAMVTIGKGIEKFQGLDINYETFPIQMENIINTLADVFARIGKEYGGAGLFGLGGGLVYQGIQSVMGMGNALSSIAFGMSKMAKLQFPTYNPDGSIKEIITLDGAAMSAINTNVAMMVESLSGAFGNIGKKYDKGEQSLWQMIKSAGKKDPVAAGISMVQGLGGAIGGIANGMRDMASLKFNVYGDPNNPQKVTKIIDLTQGNMLKKVGSNIMKLVATLVEGFAAIGKTYKDWKEKGDASRGLSIAEQMPPILGNIVKAMAEFNKSAPDAPKKINEFLLEFAKSLQELSKVDGNAVYTVSGGIRSFFNAFRFGKQGIDTMIAMGKETESLNNVSMFIEKVSKIPTTLTQTSMAFKIISSAIVRMDDLDLDDAEDLIAESGKFGNHVIVGQAIKDISKSMQTLGQVNVEGFPSMLNFIEDLEDLDLSDIKDDLRHVAKSYQMIGETTNNLDIEAIVETSNMFKALAYLSEQGGEDAIEALGDDLIKAVEKLALMIADFGGTVEEAREGNQSFIDGAMNTIKSGAAALFGGGSSGSEGTASSTSNNSINVMDQQLLIAEIKRLQNILTSGDVQVQTVGVSI